MVRRFLRAEIVTVDGHLKITGTWGYTTNNGGFHAMKAEGASISFYPKTNTLKNVQGSKFEIIGQKILQFASTGSKERHFTASNIQTNFISDDDHEQQEGGEEHETLTSDEITEDVNAHTKCSKVTEAAIRKFRLEANCVRNSLNLKIQIFQQREVLMKPDFKMKTET